jgi:hypothetical protein
VKKEQTIIDNIPIEQLTGAKSRKNHKGRQKEKRE